MSWTAWVSLATICILGAMSPGPSLAVIIRNTVAGGRATGLATALAHGVGVGVYALLVAFGLGLLVTGSEVLFRIVQLAGAAFLAYLGVTALLSTGSAEPETAEVAAGKARGARDGFLIAFLNPKIAVWFLALFSQFLRPEAGAVEKVMMAGLAAFIDAAWYAVVAIVLSQGSILEWLRRRSLWVDRIFGVILIALALRVITL